MSGSGASVSLAPTKITEILAALLAGPSPKHILALAYSVCVLLASVSRQADALMPHTQ